MIIWRGRVKREEQVANAKDSFVNLTPVSDAPAEAVKAAWSAWLPGQDIPLIGERRYDEEE
jgi:hypothetical protein